MYPDCCRERTAVPIVPRHWLNGIIPLITLAVYLSLGLSHTFAAKSGEKPSRPNVVLILADDLGWGDPACYGHPYAKTPNIDRLAREGTSFRQFYVTGCTCCPTRTGFMTGQYPARFAKYPSEYGFSGAATITDLLSKQGYATGHFGKWHIGADTAQGTYGIGTIDVIGNADDPRGRDAALTDKAIEFIRQHRAEPFYVNVWCHATHFRVDPPEGLVHTFSALSVSPGDFPVPMREHLALYESLGGKVDDGMRRYCGEMFGLDQNIGRVLATLDELDLRDNTIVVFSSDNGPAPCANEGGKRLRQQGRLKLNMLGSAGNLRGRKHKLYDGGVREPCIVRWPGHVGAGRVDSNSVTSGVDWLPTLCKIVGIKPPETQLDGEDVSDAWLGHTHKRTKPLYWKTSNVRSQIVIRDGDWKLLDPNEQRGELELYNLADDPGETQNLAASRPEIAAALKAKVRTWNATLPTSYAKGDKDDD